MQSNNFNIKRLTAFMSKETLQMIRDPSSLLIAVILPLLMIFLFCYGVSLDTNVIRIGLVQEDDSPEAKSLSDAFQNTPYFNVVINQNKEELADQLVLADIRGFVVIPQDFSSKLHRNMLSTIQVIADGTETNTASFVQNYAQGVVQTWWSAQPTNNIDTSMGVVSEPRVWFNQELKSRYVLLPGSIAVIMSLIGILLTAMVVAREWERGTMETLLTTPITLLELMLGKLLPYFFLGMGSMTLCILIAVFVFGLPFQGSFLVLAFATALFLFAGLGQGLLISILSKNQFIASQAAINAAFLPAYMLSGFLYEIESMPVVLQGITYLLPARYFVTILKSSFLTGVVWPLFWPNLLALFIMGLVFMILVVRKSKRSVE